MADLIDRQALISVFAGLVPYAIDGPEDDAYARGLDAGYQALVAAPAVDAEPVRRGRWERQELAPTSCLFCSECGFPKKRGAWNVCPNCGADLRGVENDG